VRFLLLQQTHFATGALFAHPFCITLRHEKRFVKLFFAQNSIYCGCRHENTRCSVGGEKLPQAPNSELLVALDMQHKCCIIATNEWQGIDKNPGRKGEIDRPVGFG